MIMNDPGKIRVLLVDDHPLVRLGLFQLINQQPDMEVTGQAEDAPQALDLMESAAPQVILIDLSLNKDMGGIELIKDIKVRWPEQIMLVLSMYDEAVFAERALKAGARGYVMKEEAMEIVLSAIRRVARGDIWVSSRMARKMISSVVGGGGDKIRFPTDRLTDRELEVLQLIGRGIKTKQIAEKLHLSVKTVETYRQRLKEKLRLPDSAALLEFAVQWMGSEGK